MDADQFQLREVAGDVVEIDRPADAAERPLVVIDQRLADLHLDRHIEFAAFGIERVIASIIRRQFEPMRIGVRPDEAHLLHRTLQVPQTLHAFGRVDAGEPAEAPRILPHCVGDPFVGHVPSAGRALLAELARNQERPFDAGLVHLRQHLFQRDGLHILAGAADLLGVKIAEPSRTRGHDLRRQWIDDNVDCTRHVYSAPTPGIMGRVRK